MKVLVEWREYIHSSITNIAKILSELVKDNIVRVDIHIVNRP